MQIDIGTFGLWSWDRYVEPVLPETKGASRLLVLADGPPTAGGGRMLGYARIFEDRNGQMMEDWRQTSEGFPDKWYAYPFYAGSPLEGMIRLSLGVPENDLTTPEQWEHNFPDSELFLWPGFGSNPVDTKLGPRWSGFRLYRDLSAPTGNWVLYSTGCPSGKGVWRFGADTWYGVSTNTVVLEKGHYLEATCVDTLPDAAALYTAAKPA